MSLENCLEFPAPPTMAPAAIALVDWIYESNRAANSSQGSGPSISRFNATIPPPVPHMPTTSKRKMAKKPKKVIVTTMGLLPMDTSSKRRGSTPHIVEVGDNSDKVLDWGSSMFHAEIWHLGRPIPAFVPVLWIFSSLRWEISFLASELGHQNSTNTLHSPWYSTRNPNKGRKGVT